MESTMKNLPPDTAIPADDARQEHAAFHPDRRTGRPGDDVVRWREFRLALWIGGFALAAILGGQGFLYTAIMGLQGEMHAQIGGLRIEVNTQINDLRTDMQAQFAYVHERIHELSERVARIETRLDITGDPDG